MMGMEELRSTLSTSRYKVIMPSSDHHDLSWHVSAEVKQHDNLANAMTPRNAILYRVESAEECEVLLQL